MLGKTMNLPPTCPSGFRVLSEEKWFSPRNKLQICNSRNGLLGIDECMQGNTIIPESHAPICKKSRHFYSRTFKCPFPPSDFRFLDYSLHHRNYIYSCISFECKSSNYPDLLNESSSWSASEIAEAVNGEIIRWGPSGTISTDSRNLKSGQWFFAITGENFDAHDFVNQELDDKGCVGVIGNRVCEKWQRGFVKVDGNTLIALEMLAKYARNRFFGHVVGLTGSVGKTTTRTMIALALESLGQVYQTHGNQNNQIGVALTLIGIPVSAKVSVLELGMSRKGEILKLAEMCRPSVRVILNVCDCHMENFGSSDGIADAKGELLMEAKPGDVCVLNSDDPSVMRTPVPAGVKKVFFGQRMECDVRLALAESIDGGCAVRVVLERQLCAFDTKVSTSSELATELVEFEIQGPGLHLAMNACAAAAVAISLGVSLPQVGESLSRFKPVQMRSELITSENDIRIINDVYSANPTSMRAAIALLKAMECRGNRVAILGDMLELGSIETEAHEAVLTMCCDSCFGMVALVGKRFAAAAEKLNLMGKINIIFAVDSESLALKIKERLTANDIVLVKGSRAMQMEKVVDAIKATDT